MTKEKNIKKSLYLMKEKVTHGIQTTHGINHGIPLSHRNKKRSRSSFINMTGYFGKLNCGIIELCVRLCNSECGSSLGVKLSSLVIKNNSSGETSTLAN